MFADRSGLDVQFGCDVLVGRLAGILVVAQPDGRLHHLALAVGQVGGGVSGRAVGAGRDELRLERLGEVARGFDEIGLSTDDGDQLRAVGGVFEGHLDDDRRRFLAAEHPLRHRRGFDAAVADSRTVLGNRELVDRRRVRHQLSIPVEVARDFRQQDERAVGEFLDGVDRPPAEGRLRSELVFDRVEGRLVRVEGDGDVSHPCSKAVGCDRINPVRMRQSSAIAPAPVPSPMSEPATPPSPDGLPLFGHGYAYAQDPLAAFGRWADRGDVVELRFPGQRAYLVTDPDLIERVLLDRARFELSEIQRELFAGLEDDALTATRGERWRRLRTALQPAFTRDAVDRYADGMAAAVAARVDDWDDGERFDLHREMRLLSLDVLTRTLVDVDVRGREDVILEAADATVARADPRRPGQLLPDWIPTPTDRRFRRAVRNLDAVVESAIDQRPGRTRARASAGADHDGRVEHDPGNDYDGRDEHDPGSDHDGGVEAADDVAAVLLAAHRRGDLSADEVRDNLVAMILGGHDSTAVTFTYAWYLLSGYPAVYDALVDEHDAVVGDAQEPIDDVEETDDAREPTDDADAAPLPTAGDVADLELTGNVVAETLRLYPPAIATARQTRGRVTLGGYELPEGVQVLCPQWVLHRDERFWDDPETFDPSRWGRDVDRPEFAYFPFGGGPRHCIGMRFARRELTLGLATMVGRVTLDVAVDEPLSLQPSLTLRPESELEATVRRRIASR